MSLYFSSSMITFSVVSHGHSDAVSQLLQDLNSYQDSLKISVLLTLNAPELESVTDVELQEMSYWPLTIFRNKSKKGFAENHNAAFKHCKRGIWCAVNPDIRISKDQLQKLISTLSTDDLGIAFPRQVGVAGHALDYRRKLVTPRSLIKRYFGRQPERSAEPEWVSGCFMAFRSEVYQELGGFDEKYFLYCEDVDICLRSQLAGYKMVEADFCIVHDTRRGTLKKFDHFKWHVASLLKLWCSRVFWAYLWNRHKIRRR